MACKRFVGNNKRPRLSIVIDGRRVLPAGNDTDGSGVLWGLSSQALSIRLCFEGCADGVGVPWQHQAQDFLLFS